jgi:tetratricopeptide (TPR) repeat protein
MVREANNWTAETLCTAMKRGVSYYGQLADLSHEEFVEIVQSRGGEYIRYSNHGQFAVIVVGAAALPVLPSGDAAPMPGARLISETHFLQLLGVEPQAEADRLFTAAMLAEIMGVPESRILAWGKAGLIKPARIEHGLPRYEFRQAAIARNLSEMTSAGVSIDRIRRTLRQLQQRMPDLKEPLQQLTVLEHNGPLLVRLESGDLAEVTGQMHLEFDPTPQPAPMQLRLAPTLSTAADWHERAVEQERAGLLAEAEDSYRQALLAAGPTPQFAFDLASLLTKLGKIPQAIERYMQAIELDPQNAAAWNNVGILLADNADPAAACDAFRHALAITPNDPKLHYNLADALDMLGFAEEAKRHWQAYLKHDPFGSPWSDHARQRLNAMG